MKDGGGPVSGGQETQQRPFHAAEKGSESHPKLAALSAGKKRRDAFPTGTEKEKKWGKVLVGSQAACRRCRALSLTTIWR